MGTVSDKRCALFAQGCNRQLADFTVGYSFPCLWIHNLKIQIVIPIMHSAFIITAHGNSRPIHFRQPIDIIQLNPQLRGDPFSHLFTPPLGTDHALFQMYLVRNTPFCNLLRQKQCIRRSRTQNGGFHILHHAELFIRITWSHRNRHCT